MIETDILATNVYTLGYYSDSYANLDYTNKIEILQNGFVRFGGMSKWDKVVSNIPVPKSAKWHFCDRHQGAKGGKNYDYWNNWKLWCGKKYNM